MKNKKITVSIACHNSGRFIKETLDSVLAQTYGDFEVLVLDDGSKDNTGEIVKSFRDPRIRYIYKENEGIAQTRNRAIALSSGEYIAFLDHDDLWMPAKLAEQVKILDCRRDVGFVYGNYFRMYPSGKREPVLKGPQPEGEVFGAFIRDYPVGIMTAIVRKSELDKMDELFDRRLGLTEEYDLFLRLLRKTKAAYVKEPLAVYRIHEGMQSAKLALRYPEEIEYVFKKLGRLDPDFTKRYGRQMAHMNSKVAFSRAKAEMVRNDPAAARDILKNSEWIDWRFLALYLAAFLPARFVCGVGHLYNKYILRTR